MIIADRYSFNMGEEKIKEYCPYLLSEVEEVIQLVNAETCRLKDPKGKERAKLARIGETHFYSPPHLNALFDYYLFRMKWELKPRLYTHEIREGFREMDFIKGKLGLEVQFGKYAFLTYDIVAKMVIYKNYYLIDYGIEICPMANMLPHMSSGIGAFEQVKWDLVCRGVANELDVPVLLLGVTSEKIYSEAKKEANAQQLTMFKQIGDKATTERYRIQRLGTGTLRKVKETGIEPDTKM